MRTEVGFGTSTGERYILIYVSCLLRKNVNLCLK